MTPEQQAAIEAHAQARLAREQAGAAEVEAVRRHYAAYNAEADAFRECQRLGAPAMSLRDRRARFAVELETVAT